MMQIHQEIIPNIRTVGNIIDKFSGTYGKVKYLGLQKDHSRLQ